MRKKYLAMLTALMLLVLAGCGKNGNSEQTTGESAVDYSTADSDTDGYVDDAEVPDMNEDTEEEEEVVVYADAEITCELPKGFKAVEGEPGFYTTKNYPQDVSNIDYVISESEEDISTLDELEFKKEVESDIYDLYGDEVDVEIYEYEKITIDGRHGLRIYMSYDIRGTSFEQLEYMLFNGKESHIITYTQEKGGKWMDKFMESGRSIAFTK